MEGAADYFQFLSSPRSSGVKHIVDVLLGEADKKA
jgi:hypothetical protein